MKNNVISKNDISSVSVALKKKNGYSTKNSVDILRNLLEKKNRSDGLNPYSRKLSNYEKNRKNNSGPTATEVIQKYSQLYYGSGLTESNFIEAVEMFNKFKSSAIDDVIKYPVQPLTNGKSSCTLKGLNN